MDRATRREDCIGYLLKEDKAMALPGGDANRAARLLYVRRVRLTGLRLMDQARSPRRERSALPERPGYLQTFDREDTGSREEWQAIRKGTSANLYSHLLRCSPIRRVVSACETTGS